MTVSPNSRLRHLLTWHLSLLLIALAALVLPSVAHAQASTPTVSTAAITSSPGADNTYATGDTITVSLTFSEAVTVTGTPHVVVDIGGQPRNFKYSGDGSTAAAQPFSYTVLVGDKDADGVSLLVNSLALNGGTIQATDDSTSATLTHTAMAFTNHKVDTEVTLLSTLGQPDVSDAVTISATESVRVRIRVAADKFVDINAITLDVKTPSPTLEVTARLYDHEDGGGRANYTYTGSVTAAGLQTFTLSGPSGVRFGNIGRPASVEIYAIEIRGSGAGSVELLGTDSILSDSGGVSGLSIVDRTGGRAYSQMRLSGHEGSIPNLLYGAVVSSPPDGTAYAAGDRIDMLFMFSRPVDVPDGLVVPIWLGNGAQHRREARLAVKSFENQFLVFSYAVQSADTDTDGIYIGANPLGDNAGITFHAENIPAVPAHIAVAANQLTANQSVNGSGTRTCEEVFCSTVLAGVDADRTGFGVREGPSTIPFVPLGASSEWYFGYGGEEDIVAQITFFDATHSLGPHLLELLFELGLPGPLRARLTLSVDGTVFLLSEADEVASGYRFRWYSPGLTWADGDAIAVKLIETATATFDAASYTKTEGDSFDVTVTLGDSFENTLTLPVVVTSGGADAADYSGIPENLVFAPGEMSKTFTVTIVDDIRDEEVESLTLSFDDPHIKSGGTNETATVTITDNDPPEVDFGASSYTVAEGGMQTVTVTLTSAPGSAVTIPITTTDQGSTTPADYSGVPANVMFSTGQTYAFFTFRATQDTEDDDDESVKLTFGTLPSGVQAGTTTEVTFDITDDDDPQVTASFGAGAYTVAEGGTQAVTVTLSADPERTVDIPLVPTYEGGATAADYSGVPASLTFDAGVLLKTITFTATQDTEDDDDERVLLAFGSLPERVSAGTTNQVIFDITDDDDPQVTVSFGQAGYTVAEGETVTVRVTLSADPERTVAIPITAMNQGGATSADYSGVPASLTFNTGDTLKTVTFSATEDEEDEDGESVKLTFGSLPGGVQKGTIDAATVSIGDDCGAVDIWCATTTFGATVHWAGRYDLYTGEADNTEFSYNGADYRLWSIEMEQNGHDSGDDNQVVQPFGIPERTHFLIDFLNLSGTSDQVFDPPNNDWLDWAVHVGTVSDGETLTATLRFSEARKLAGAWWRWSGGDIDGLRRAWKTDQLYKLRLVEDPRSGRTPQPLNPPLYLSVQGEINMTHTWLRWLTPQTRHDRVPPVDSYRIQWKQSSGSWDTASDVSETTRGPSRQRPVSHHLDGLTPGVEYNIRVIATDSAGDSEPSNEVTYTKLATSQQSLSNSPAEGEPRIDGIPEVGQALSADTTGISDVDGLDDVIFQYQWLAGDADIAGSTGSTYTLTSEHLGQAIRVRVAFTDDGGNEEALTSAPIVVTAAGLQLRSATVDRGMLTLTYSKDLDTGVSLGTAPFAVNVNGSSRSLSGVAVGQSSVLLLLSQAVEAGDTVTVDYTVPDGQDFIRDTLGRKAASFSERAVTNSTAEDQEDTARGTEDADTEPEYASAVVEPPLTATIHDAPASHDGSAAFTFELELSEELAPDFSYRTLWDHGFTVAGGSVTYVRRLVPPSNIGWEVHVTPDGNGDVDLSLRSTTDCSAQGAICTGEGRKLSGGLQLAVAGPNTPATGAPTISGTARVGETLTAGTTEISDADGLGNAVFAYQWLAGDAEINGATASTYTLADADEGKAIRVRVSFTDDGENGEELTSAATGAVDVAPPPPNTPATGAPTISGTARVGETLTAGTTEISDADGLGNAVFAYQWLAGDAEINGATASTYTLADADEGKAIRVRVSFTDDGENGEELTSAATGAVDVAPPPPNTPATGAPTISGTARVGETLTAGTTEISDADGLGNAVFAYQWLAGDSEINGATASTYTLADADEGKAIRVRVSFTDDGENGEVLTSDGTGAVAAAVVRPPLTATARNVPSSHDGSATFLFELRFSEEFPLSYVTLRDHAFTVSGGRVTYVRRLNPPSNIGWEIHVTPDSGGSLTIVLPETGSCEANGAICAEDGRRLSNRLEFTVNGP